MLTHQLYDELYNLRTKSGYSLDKAIQLSVDIPSTEIGFMIGDEETVTIFLKFLKKVISKCQKYYKEDSHLRFTHKTSLNPVIKFNEPKTLKNFIFDIKFYLKRNLKGYSLPAHCTRAERREINAILVNLLKGLTYNSEKQSFKFDKSKMNGKDSMEIIDDEKKVSYSNINVGDSFLSEKESKIIDLSQIDDGTLSELEMMSFAPNRQVSLTEEYLVSGLSRDFPDARSIFYNIESGVGAWTNHENHIEFVILDEDASLVQLYKKFVNLLLALKVALKENEIEFIRNKQFGYILTNPKEIGTGLVIDIYVKCPFVAKHGKFNYILDKFNLQLIDNKGLIYHFQTINTLGRTEHQIVQSLADSFILLIRMEKMLAKNKDIDSIIPLI